MNFVFAHATVTTFKVRYVSEITLLMLQKGSVALHLVMISW